MRELQYKNERHDHEIILKSPKTDIVSCKKNIKNLDKEKLLIVISETLIGAASTLSSSTIAMFNPSAGIITSRSTALLTSLAILITID